MKLIFLDFYRAMHFRCSKYRTPHAISDPSGETHGRGISQTPWLTRGPTSWQQGTDGLKGKGYGGK